MKDELKIKFNIHPFWVILQIALVVLKLFQLIAISWFWVFTPLWFVIIFFITALLFFGLLIRKKM